MEQADKIVNRISLSIKDVGVFLMLERFGFVKVVRTDITVFKDKVHDFVKERLLAGVETVFPQIVRQDFVDPFPGKPHNTSDEDADGFAVGDVFVVGSRAKLVPQDILEVDDVGLVELFDVPDLRDGRDVGMLGEVVDDPFLVVLELHGWDAAGLFVDDLIREISLDDATDFTVKELNEVPDLVSKHLELININSLPKFGLACRFENVFLGVDLRDGELIKQGAADGRDLLDGFRIVFVASNFRQLDVEHPKVEDL